MKAQTTAQTTINITQRSKNTARENLSPHTKNDVEVKYAIY